MVWTPAVDVVETPEAFEVYAVLPNAEGNLKVRAQDNTLVISGETKDGPSSMARCSGAGSTEASSSLHRCTGTT